MRFCGGSLGLRPIGRSSRGMNLLCYWVRLYMCYCSQGLVSLFLLSLSFFLIEIHSLYSHFDIVFSVLLIFLCLPQFILRLIVPLKKKKEHFSETIKLSILYQLIELMFCIFCCFLGLTISVLLSLMSEQLCSVIRYRHVFFLFFVQYFLRFFSLDLIFSFLCSVRRSITLVACGTVGYAI